jgi:lipocalin-like protein
MITRRISLLAVLLVGILSAAAQTSSIAGTWVLAAADKQLPDGTRVLDYGPNPQGLLIFTADGYYSVQIYRAEQEKFSSGDKLKGTQEEYRDAVLASSVHFGRYSVDPIKHTITFQVEKSVFPNWNETTQVRPYELKGDELSWKSGQRPDGSIPITVVRRVKTKD